MGVPLGISSFMSSFIKETMLEDVRHVDLLPIMGDVQVAFGIITHCFMQWPSYLLWCTPPFSTFTSFDSSFLQVFDPWSFDNLKGPLARSIHGWGSKKGKKDLRTFLNYFLQITFIWIKLKWEKLNSPI